LTSSRPPAAFDIRRQAVAWPDPAVARSRCSLSAVRWPVIVFGVALALSACSDGSSDGSEPASADAVSLDDATTDDVTSVPGDDATAGATSDVSSDDSAGTDLSCGEIFVVGAVLTAAEVQQSCRLDDGTTASGSVSPCVDGRELVSFDAREPNLWGIVGEPLVAASAGENATDPEYVALLDLC
jgi:hypothetical protein